MSYIGTIRVDRMKCHAHHGVGDDERLIGNDFEVSIEVKACISDGLVHDDLKGTVNYARLIEIIKREMAIPSRLLEHVAWRIHTAVTSEFETIAGSVTVTKLTPPVACEVAGVSVTYNWGEDE